MNCCEAHKGDAYEASEKKFRLHWSTISVKSELPLAIPNKRHVYTLTDLSNLYELNESIYVFIRTKLNDKEWSMHGIDVKGDDVLPQLVPSDDEGYSIYSLSGEIKSIVIDMEFGDVQYDAALEVVSVSSSRNEWANSYEQSEEHSDEEQELLEIKKLETVSISSSHNRWDTKQPDVLPNGTVEQKFLRERATARRSAV